MAEEPRLLRIALGIDEDRQVAAQPHRIHSLEEERAVPAEQILHIVLRGRDQHVDAGVLHQAVEPGGVERDIRRDTAWFHGVEHCWNSLFHSAAIARIDAIEHAQISRPVGGATAAVVGFVLRDGLLADLGGNLDELTAGRFHGKLDLGGLEQMLHQGEGLARALAHGQHAVVLHDQRPLVREMRDDPLPLAEILGDAFVRMIADAIIEAHRLLRDHAQPALEAGDRGAGAGMHVHGAIDVRPPAQHPTMQGEARPVDACTLVEVGVHVDLDQVRGRDLGPEELVLLHQELARLAGHAHGAVIVDHVVPAVMRNQTVDGRQIDPRLPLGRRHRDGRRRGRLGVNVHDDLPAAARATACCFDTYGSEPMARFPAVRTGVRSGDRARWRRRRAPRNRARRASTSPCIRGPACSRNSRRPASARNWRRAGTRGWRTPRDG